MEDDIYISSSRGCYIAFDELNSPCSEKDCQYNQ